MANKAVRFERVRNATAKVADSVIDNTNSSDSVQLAGATGLLGGALAASFGVLGAIPVVGVSVGVICAFAALEQRRDQIGTADCVAKAAGRWCRSWFVAEPKAKA
jgi:hypothetical protein